VITQQQHLQFIDVFQLNID